MFPYTASLPSVATPAPRIGFVDAHPELREEHLHAQRAMFKAARDARLSWSRDLQIRGMNEALGLRGVNRIASRRELSIAQMRAVTVAIEEGLFQDDWTWGHPFIVSIRTRTVEMTEIHFTPTQRSASA